MTYPLVTTQWLEQHLEDADLRVIEISQAADNAAYREGHIPGAAWFHWKDICWHPTDRQFVTPEALARRLGVMGIGPRTNVVLYGDPVQFGTYVFWSFTMGGHANLRLLDGSRTKWVKEDRPLSNDMPRLSPPVDYPPGNGDTSMRIGRDDIRAKLGRPGRLLLDVRSPEEYSGERVIALPKFDHGAERAGRIPGAVHLFFRNLLNDDDTYKSREELLAAFEGVGATPDKVEEIVVYCRLSHRASFTWVAMKHILGFENVRIYDGSWTEWGSIVGFPVEK
ncbi:MAG: sulfurtransferase [Hyphomicrobiales bacterium]|nr:sulfurtransferase [Hyphomicrobiales bacterium]